MRVVIGVLLFHATGKSTTFWLERSARILELIGSDRSPTDPREHIEDGVEPYWVR